MYYQLVCRSLREVSVLIEGGWSFLWGQERGEERHV